MCTHKLSSTFKCIALLLAAVEYSFDAKSLALLEEKIRKARTKKRGKRERLPLCRWIRLEGEAESELALQRARSVGAGRVDESYGLGKGRRRGDIVPEVVAVVGAIGQVESLRDELHVRAFS